MSSSKTVKKPRLKSRRGSLDVVVLHDETETLRGREGEEAHIGVWEAILPIEESLAKLKHRPIRLSLGLGTSKVIAALEASKPDVVFHLAETAFGDTIGEAQVAAMLDLLHLPHTSASPDALLLCRDKLKAKAVLREHGISTPPHAVSLDGTLPARLPVPPWISKPALEDGSIGIESDAVTSDPVKLRRRVHALFGKLRQPILIETYIDGREFNVGVVGDDVLPLSEIDFSKLPAGESRIVNFESKWKYDTVYFKGTTTVCPAPVDAAARDRINLIGLNALAALNVRGYSRVDLRMDNRGQLYILEVNPNPDLSPIAGMAKMAETAGWGFDGLIDRILKMALRPSQS